MAKSLGWYRPEMMILKVTLGGTDPPIWRRLKVDSGLTLHELHYAIQAVFMWEDAHLYHFLVPPGGKLTQSALREAVRYHVLPPDPVFGDDEDDDERPADEAMLGRVFTAECKQIVYEYDFGDSWEHIVKLEKRTPDGDPNHIPECLAGENAAPVDDLGGVWGFYEYLDALADKKNEAHEDAVDVLGKKFDPAKFDLALANKRLKATFRLPPKKKKNPRKPKGA